MKQSTAIAFVGLVFILAAAAASGYALLPGPPRWSTNIVMHLQLSDSNTLIDGSDGWNRAVESPMSDWNNYISGVEFRVVRESTARIAEGDGVNSVFWGDDVFGRSFGNAVAITTRWTRNNSATRTEADVVFNRAYSWNSYRGYPLRRTSSGATLYDIKRVAMHEYGHALGLDHPNEAGQSVDAVMNTPSHQWERLTADDVAGARALYPGSTGPPTGPGPTTPVVINFPPRNESLAFRNLLEARYRDTLRRPAGSSFVDIEGTVVWTQEYLRYRVNRCEHSDAVNRVMMQIDGRGIQPVCGTATSAAFPPRNEPFDFRNQLETKYRDGLRRGGSSTHVDREGDIVWTQEYLRYRVNRCSHQQSLDRVFLQIDGRGVQPTC